MITLSKHAIEQCNKRGINSAAVLRKLESVEDKIRCYNVAEVRVIVKRLQVTVSAGDSSGDTVVAALVPGSGIVKTVMFSYGYQIRERSKTVPYIE